LPIGKTRFAFQPVPILPELVKFGKIVHLNLETMQVILCNFEIWIDLHRYFATS
jgi:hypothetical protein